MNYAEQDGEALLSYFTPLLTAAMDRLFFFFFYKGSFSNEKHNSCKLPSIFITLGVCANNKFVLEKWVIVWALQTKKT